MDAALLIVVIYLWRKELTNWLVNTIRRARLDEDPKEVDEHESQHH